MMALCQAVPGKFPSGHCSPLTPPQLHEEAIVESESSLLQPVGGIRQGIRDDALGGSGVHMGRKDWGIDPLKDRFPNPMAARSKVALYTVHR